MTDSKPLNCPCCGSTATVEPHLIESGVFTADKTWPAWWTASVNCDSCALQFVGGDTGEEAVEDALEGWNRRTAVSSVYTETLKAEMKKATALMRDLWALTDEMFRFKASPSINTMAEFEERLEEFGIGANDGVQG